MATRVSLRKMKEKRQKERTKFVGDLNQAKVLMDEDLEGDALSKQATQVKILIKRVQKNIDKYVKYVEDIVVQFDSEPREEDEQEEQRREENKDDDCIQAAEDSISEMETWLEEKFPDKQGKAAATVTTSPRRQASDPTVQTTQVDLIKEGEKVQRNIMMALDQNDADVQKVWVTFDIDNMDTIALGTAIRQISTLIKNMDRNEEKFKLVNTELLDAHQKVDDQDAFVTFQNGLIKIRKKFENRVSDHISRLEVFKEELENKKKSLLAASDGTEQEMHRLQQQVQQLMTERRTVGTATGTGSAGSVSTASVHLPKLDIEKFDGHILKWQSFWDSFDSAVNKNVKLNNVEKFNYLRSKLSGDASNAISGLQLSNDNYPIALNLLQKRFGDTQAIINAHYIALTELTAATNQVFRLRQLHDNLEKHLRSLEAAGQDVTHPQFVAMIQTKLPKEVLRHLNMQNDDDEPWTVEKLRKMLGRFVTASEKADSQGSQSVPVTSKPKSRWGGPERPYRTGSYEYGESHDDPSMEHEHRNTSSALFTGRNSGPPEGRRNKMCAYCKGDETHWSDECTVYPTLKARRARIYGHCNKCLVSGHVTSECRSSRYCIHCGEKGKHHRSLCPKTFPETDAELAAMTVEQSDEDKESEEEIQHFSAADSESTLLAAGERVVMQTATVKVINPKKVNVKEPVLARLLMDSASHRCYMTDKLADKLELETEKVEELSVITFGSKTPKKVKTRQATVEIQLGDGEMMPIKVSIVPVISGKILRHPASCNKELTQMFKEKALADTLPTEENEKTEIDFLLGANYYFDILLNQGMQAGCQMQNGLYVLNTKLGWIVGGKMKAEPQLKKVISEKKEVKVETTVHKVSKESNGQNSAVVHNKQKIHPAKLAWVSKVLKSRKDNYAAIPKSGVHSAKLAWAAKIVKLRKESKGKVKPEGKQEMNGGRDNTDWKMKPQMVQRGSNQFVHYNSPSQWHSWKPPNRHMGTSTNATIWAQRKHYQVPWECRADHDMNWRSKY